METQYYGNYIIKIILWRANTVAILLGLANPNPNPNYGDPILEA